MKKNIKDLEEKLKKITGEDKLPEGDITGKKNKKKFNASEFLKLAKEVGQILIDDAKNSNPALKS
ncbi:hypothetical protein KJ980_01470 [Patescibacteria group bacterium]|nr:hypothetical protein [Patescibacteria group bacterium]MBU4017410.1 hypothetical protein [Patescibacteria group bacterium]MBU4098296.1 hypothetical protein [Patescibacteria group bacterium]